MKERDFRNLGGMLATNYARGRFGLLRSLISIRRELSTDRSKPLGSLLRWHNLLKHDVVNLVFRRLNNAPSERPTPVAPDHNKPLTFRTTMRNFVSSLSAGLIIGRTRDPDTRMS